MKYFKLGEKASSFYDPTSKVKLTPGVVVEVDGKIAKGRKIAEAKRAGHIVEVDEDEYNEFVNPSEGGNGDDEVEMNADIFAGLNVQAMKDYLLKSYENTPEEVLEINSFTKKKELSDKYHSFENPA